MISDKNYELVAFVMGLPVPREEQHSAELGKDMLLLKHDKPIDVGVILNNNGWTPQIASLKGGGQYVDHPSLEGGALNSTAPADVLETFNGLVKGNSVIEMARYISKLQKWVARARELATTYHAIDPVYIEWKPLGVEIHQYAKIKNIEISIANPSKDESNTSRNITILVTREPYWRVGVAPGDNPKKSAFIRRGEWKDWARGDLTLLPNVNPSAPVWLKGDVEQEIYNKMEHDPAGSNTEYTTNFITIPAEDIPGDAPALTSIGIYFPDSSPKWGQVFISRQTKKPVPVSSIAEGLSRFVRDRLIHNGGDAGLITTGTITVAYNTGMGGVASHSDGAGQYVADVTIPAGALNDDGVLGWGQGYAPLPAPANPVGGYYLRANAMRGRYNVYLRHRLVSGTATDLDLYVRVKSRTGNATGYLENYQDSTRNANPVTVTTANNFSLLSLGTVELPIGNNPEVDLSGLLIDDDFTGALSIELRHRSRASGAGLVVRVVDLILVPFDEPSAVIVSPGDFVDNSLTGGDNKNIVLDNTGYSGRGRAGDIATIGTEAPNIAGQSGRVMTCELNGGNIMLLPDQDNVLHFLNTNKIALGSDYEEVSTPDDPTTSGLSGSTGFSGKMVVAVNYIPRCTYIADIEV